MEVWSSITDVWRETGNLSDADFSGSYLLPRLEHAQSLAAEFRLAITGTRLRSADFDFLSLGRNDGTCQRQQAFARCEMSSAAARISGRWQ